MSWGEIAQERLAEIAKCSAGGPGVTRFPFTPEHRAALEQIRVWMERAGLTVSLDAAGTLVGRGDGEGPSILMGSHQDSVRNAGRYDGIMGVALACLALEKLQSEGRLPACPVEVLAFADEEGVRFPTALLGPRALAGTVDPTVLEMADKDGCLLGEALDAFGGDSNRITSLSRDPQSIRAYLEIHIEQGPVLEQMDAPLGVVTGICGIERSTITLWGITGHAGTVPMTGRSDALVAASDFISSVHDEALTVPELRATVGTCAVSPNVANGVPEHVELTLEIRAPDDQSRRAFSEKCSALVRHLAKLRRCEADLVHTYEQPAVPCDLEIRKGLKAAIEDLGLDAIELPSGATHDASAMADLCDIGMLFLRCRNGVSHRPDEFASSKDMDMGINALSEFLASL